MEFVRLLGQGLGLCAQGIINHYLLPAPRPTVKQGPRRNPPAGDLEHLFQTHGLSTQLHAVTVVDLGLGPLVLPRNRCFELGYIGFIGWLLPVSDGPWAFVSSSQLVDPGLYLLWSSELAPHLQPKVSVVLDDKNHSLLRSRWALGYRFKGERYRHRDCEIDLQACERAGWLEH